MRNTQCLAVLALVYLTLAPAVASAKIPPLSQEDREARADLIIEGVILSVKPVGKVFDDACYSWQKNDARVIVKKVWKGGPVPKVITVSYSIKVKDEKMCDGGRDSYSLQEHERFKMYLAKGKGHARYHFFNSTCLERLPRKKSAAINPGSLDCVAQVRKLIQDGYNDGLMELVELDGPYSWTEGDGQKHAFVVTYCNPGDTSSKARRKKNCQKTRRREIRVATCGGKNHSGIVDVNGDKFVDLSDLVRAVRRK